MNYQSRDRQRNNNKYLLRAIFVFCILALTFFLFESQFKNMLGSMQRGVGYVFGYYGQTVRPVSENSLVQMLRSENAELKELLGRRTSEDDSKVLSVVIMRPPKTPYDSLMIDTGEDQGIVLGDRVYAENDYLIGYVDEVRDKTSIVKLFSTPGERIDVVIGVGSTTANVVAEGHGSGNFYIKAPKNIEVKELDPVVVPGTYSYILGSLEKIESSEGEAFTHLYFKLPVNLNSLKYVNVQKINR
jgi:rod shape-determining protein MreC